CVRSDTGRKCLALRNLERTRGAQVRDRAKRMVDLCVAGPAFVLLLPFMIIVGAVVYCTMGGPLLFRPMRPGYKAKPFRLFKFRTMTTACDSRGELLPDRDRLTRLGKFLR